MALISEYIDKRLSSSELQNELISLIKSYNDYNSEKTTYLFVYASAIGKPIPDIPLSMDDYYNIYDMLRKVEAKNLDFYIETLGGSGEAAEAIAEFVHEQFDKISFVISAEAKSAGTILVLSGDEIYMTRSGSLGPIDAQVKIGRTVISAYDYMDWVKRKKKKAEKDKSLSPFDATMIAQISPGELEGVNNALKFAEEMVKEWIAKYKFKNWTETETNHKKVTDDMRKKRAEEIAQDLIKHDKWKSHGRSLNINNLEEIGLKIHLIDNDPELSEIVYKIQTVIRLLLTTTSAYKIFATADDKLIKTAVEKNSPQKIPVKTPDAVEVGLKCNNCKNQYKFYLKFVDDPKIDEEFQKKGLLPFPKDAKFKCSCGYEMDLSGIKNDIETKTGKKIL
ncbi:Serine dehydrogenase proteinase [anaerobic digester metagenome]